MISTRPALGALFALVIALSAGCARTSSSTESALEANKDVVRRAEVLINAQDYDKLQTFSTTIMSATRKRRPAPKRLAETASL